MRLESSFGFLDRLKLKLDAMTAKIDGFEGAVIRLRDVEDATEWLSAVTEGEYKAYLSLREVNCP